MLASIRPEWRSREVGEVRERFSTPMESPWHMVVGYGTRHEVTRLSYVLLHYRNHVMTRYYGLYYGYRSFVRGNYRPGQMLDAIIIAGLRSWRRVERERERWVSFFFWKWNIYPQKRWFFLEFASKFILETVGRWANICIYSNDYWSFVTLIFVVTVEF